MVIYSDQWVFLDYLPVPVGGTVAGYYLPLTDALNGWWQVRVGEGTHGNRVGFINSNSEMHMTAIYSDARLIYGSGGFHGYLYAVQL